MTDRQRRQPGYILHRRAYRETSYLADILTPNFGRLAAVFRGSRKKQGMSLEPFVLCELADAPVGAAPMPTPDERPKLVSSFSDFGD